MEKKQCQYLLGQIKIFSALVRTYQQNEFAMKVVQYILCYITQSSVIHEKGAVLVEIAVCQDLQTSRLQKGHIFLW